jgi:hypothetical protein
MNRMDEDDDELEIIEEAASQQSQYIRVFMRDSHNPNAPITVLMQPMLSARASADVLSSFKPYNQTTPRSSAPAPMFSPSHLIQNGSPQEQLHTPSRYKPVAVNRMRGNINVFIPMCESEEQILQTEALKYGPEEPDFANILTTHSSAFHPLRTPQILQKHYQLLKDAGVDFNNIDSIPPEYLYNIEQGDVQTPTSRVKKAKKTPSEKKKSSRKSPKESQKEKKGTKRKKDDDTTGEERFTEEEDDEIKSSATGRFGAKKRSSKKKTPGQKKSTSKKRKTEEGTNSSVLFQALNMIGQEGEDSRSEEDVPEDPMVSVLLGLSQAVDKPHEGVETQVTADSNRSHMDIDDEIALDEASEILNGPSNSTVKKSVASKGVGTHTEGTSQFLDDSLLAQEGDGETNISYKLLMDENENSRKTGVYELEPPIVTTSTDTPIGRLHTYLIDKLELRPSIKLDIMLSGKTLDPALKINQILLSYGIDPKDLILTYRSRTTTENSKM